MGIADEGVCLHGKWEMNLFHRRLLPPATQFRTHSTPHTECLPCLCLGSSQTRYTGAAPDGGICLDRLPGTAPTWA